MIRDSLRALLLAHVPADGTEARHRERMLELVLAPRPFDRESFHPGHFTASAFVLSPERDALLLILHAKLGLWLQPGGHVEPGDPSMEVAARREVAEETGLTALAPDTRILDVDVHRIPSRKADPGHEHFDVRFLLRATTLDHAASDEVHGSRWVKLTELAAVTGDESVLRAARKLAP